MPVAEILRSGTAESEAQEVADDCEECGGEGIVTRAFADPHDQPCPECQPRSAPAPATTVNGAATSSAEPENGGHR